MQLNQIVIDHILVVFILVTFIRRGIILFDYSEDVSIEYGVENVCAKTISITVFNITIYRTRKVFNK